MVQKKDELWFDSEFSLSDSSIRTTIRLNGRDSKKMKLIDPSILVSGQS